MPAGVYLNRWLWAVIRPDDLAGCQVWFVGTREECEKYASQLKTPLLVKQIIVR